jgi:hypothetical protein
MKRFSEQLHKEAGRITMTAREKEALLARVTAFCEYHPLPSTATTPRVITPKSTKAKFAEPFIEWAMPRRYYKSLVAGCLLLVVVGVPALAERAVPGDLLYAMKVQVNEEVRASLTSSGYEKVAWETKRLERRIAEARVLAKEGRLTKEVSEGVIAAVAAHQAETESELATLRTTDAEAAALAELTIVSVLNVQSAALRAVDMGSTTDGVSTVALALALDQVQEQVAQKSDEAVSYERLIAQLEIETTRSRELLASIQDVGTEQELKDIERRIGDVERKITAARGLSTSNMTEATDALKAAWRDTQVIITFMTDIDVRTALAIETMVPVVLTPEEERALATAAYEEANRGLATITSVLPQVADQGVSEKVAITVPRITELLETASSTLDTDVLAAKAAATEARDYTRSILSLAQFIPNADGVIMTTVLDTASSSEATTTDESVTPEDESGDEPQQ